MVSVGKMAEYLKGNDLIGDTTIFHWLWSYWKSKWCWLMSLDFCRGLHFCCVKPVICCQWLCFFEPFLPWKETAPCGGFWSFASTSTKIQPTFWKRKCILTASNFKFSGVRVFFRLDDLQLICLSGVETWPFFGGSWSLARRRKMKIQHRALEA